MKKQSIAAEVRKALREELAAARATEAAAPPAAPLPPVEPPPCVSLHDPVGDAERFPLRASYVAALKAQVQLLGATAVAAAVGTSAVHLAYYCEGGIPSVTDRQRAITYLLRSGVVRPAPGDFAFDPDGSEDPRAVKRWARRYGPEARR